MSPEEEALGVTDCFHHRVPTGEMPDFYRSLDAFNYAAQCRSIQCRKTAATEVPR